MTLQRRSNGNLMLLRQVRDKNSLSSGMSWLNPEFMILIKFATLMYDDPV